VEPATRPSAVALSYPQATIGAITGPPSRATIINTKITKDSG
jgi:hypothetical protein